MKNNYSNTPNIVETILDEKGEVIARIAADYVVRSPQEVDDILDKVGHIYGDALLRRTERPEASG